MFGHLYLFPRSCKPALFRRAHARMTTLTVCALFSLLAACGGETPATSPPAAPTTAPAAQATTPPADQPTATTAAGGSGATTSGGTILFGAPLGLTGSLSKESKLTQQGYELWK